MNTWQKLKNDPQLFHKYLIREKVYAAIRKFFHTENFHEVEVPLLANALPPESYVEIFATTLLNRHRQGRSAYLTTSPEMFLKKLLVAGVGSCYSLTKSFRNTEDLSTTHNPEFTILEWYHVGADYTQVMEDTENLLLHIFASLHPRKSEPKITYQGQVIDLSTPWQRVSITQAFAKYARVNLQQALKLGAMRKIAQTKGYRVEKETGWEELFHQIYLNEVVPQFPKNKPTVIYDYPQQLAALAAKPKKSDPRFAERFEVYIGGIELADGCTELTDVNEQQQRFAKEAKALKKSGKSEYQVDREFLEALKLGLPNCAGIALGVDRLVMLFADAARIQDTLFFPAEEMWERKL